MLFKDIVFIWTTEAGDFNFSFQEARGRIFCFEKCTCIPLDYQMTTPCNFVTLVRLISYRLPQNVEYREMKEPHDFTIYRYGFTCEQEHTLLGGLSKGHPFIYDLIKELAWSVRVSMKKDGP